MTSEPTESQRRAAAELNMPVEEIVRIMDVWEKHAMNFILEKRK